MSVLSTYVPMVSPLYTADNMLRPGVFCVQELAAPPWGWRRRLHNATTSGETPFAMVVDRSGRAARGDEQLTGNEAQTQRYGGGVRYPVGAGRRCGASCCRTVQETLALELVTSGPLSGVTRGGYNGFTTAGASADQRPKVRS